MGRDLSQSILRSRGSHSNKAVEDLVRGSGYWWLMVTMKAIELGESAKLLSTGWLLQIPMKLGAEVRASDELHDVSLELATTSMYADSPEKSLYSRVRVRV